MTKKILILQKDDVLRHDLYEQLRDAYPHYEIYAYVDFDVSETFDLTIALFGDGHDMAHIRACSKKIICLKYSHEPIVEGVDGCFSIPIQLHFLCKEIERILEYKGDDRCYLLDRYSFYPDDRVIKDSDGHVQVELTEKESTILEYLCCSHRYQARRIDLMRDVWGYKEGISTTTLESHVHRLRIKFKQMAWKVLSYENGFYSLAVENIVFPSFTRYKRQQEKDTRDL